MQSQLEDNRDVKTFINMKVPTIDIMAKAYFARDNIMELIFVNEKMRHLDKLGYTPESIQRCVNLKFKNHLYSLADKFITNPSKDAQYNFLDEFDNFITSKEIEKYTNSRTMRFNQLNSIDNHLDFYHAMTKEELEHLGW